MKSQPRKFHRVGFEMYAKILMGRGLVLVMVLSGIGQPLSCDPAAMGPAGNSNLMFQHLTWQQFLVAASVLSLVWYGALALFYRKQVREVWRGMVKRSAPLLPARKPVGTAEISTGEPEGQEAELMGKPAMPAGMSRVSMNLFGFADPLGADEDAEERRQRQRGLIPDVIQELKNIFHVLETEQGGKAEFTALFGLVSMKYPQIRGTADQGYLNGYIRDHVLFPISDAELDALWG
ncbi:hypothetical protein KXD93_22530 [Mucilaginibacter sp. BJC16-A38]|uniref:hypothetical protein n=1 Tax=Mucilaginibacter phenanthrenivorans TaxID=1234842 RepID=UPI0021573DF2|nr:hypothetical protein [Mucilaginibacter phenanthrenivorans]MCR8560448.1 hypothetical protein [Mucilaginibacter phenanthrenivorans]